MNALNKAQGVRGVSVLEDKTPVTLEIKLDHTRTEATRITALAQQALESDPRNHAQVTVKYSECGERLLSAGLTAQQGNKF